MRIPSGFVAVLATAFSASAQAPLRELAAPTEALVFKSGQSFLYREVEIEPGAGSTRLRLPEALHGTVWLGSDDVELRRAVARTAETTETHPVADLGGVVQRAVGHEVRFSVELGSGELAHPSGRILRTIRDTTSQPRTGAQPAYYGSIPVPPSAMLVVVQVGDEVQVYPLTAVRAVHHLDGALADAPWEFEQEVEVPVLDVAHAALGEGAGRIGMQAMSDGLAWTPSYVLELGEDGAARLVGKAVLVNDAEPLVDTRIRLVIGYPNLRFASVRSSLLPDVTLDEFRRLLAALDGGQVGSQRGVMSQIMSNVASPYASGRAQVAGPSGPTPGEESEDLYLYDVGRVTLAKGERAYLPLVDARVPFRHRYDWELPDHVDRRARFVDRSDEEPVPVWHVLLLDNETDAPWTTAPILVQNDKGPVAQSMLRYTAAGSENQVRLTKALNLVGETFEFRADDARATRDETWLFGNRYEEVEVRGQIELTNRSKELAPVRIRKHFSGDLISADGEPKVQGQAKGLGQVNASRTATWTFELAAGESWKAEYRYRVLIRR